MEWHMVRVGVYARCHFRRGVNEIFALLGCHTAQIDRYLRTFRDNLSVPSFRVKQSKESKKLFLDCWTFEDGTYRMA